MNDQNEAREALGFLDALNADGGIAYSDYVQLHGLISVIPQLPAPSDDERTAVIEELASLRHIADTMRAVSDALRTRYADDSTAGYFMRQINTALAARRSPVPADTPSEGERNAIEQAVITMGYGSGEARDIASEVMVVLARRSPVPADTPSECEHDWQNRVGGGSKCTKCDLWQDRRVASRPTPPEDVAALIEEAKGWDADGVHQHAMSALDTIHRLTAALTAVPADGETESERWFRAGWEESGEGYNGEYPDEGVPWHKSEGRKAYLRLTAPIPEGSAD